MMKRLMLVLTLLLGLLPMTSAGENTNKIIDGLLGLGVRALQAEQELEKLDY